MTDYEFLLQSSFHDATLVQITLDKSLATLTIEYYDRDDREKSIKVQIVDISQIFRCHIPTQDFKMEGDDGGIISLKQSDQRVTLLVDWCKYSPNSHVNCFYEMPGAKIQQMPESS